MKSKYLVPILIIVLILVTLVAVKTMPKKQPVTVTPAPQTATTTQAAPNKPSVPFVPVSTLAPTTVPKAMPSDLPFESGATILQNFEIKDPTTGKTQSTRVYISKKTIDDNYTLYQSYLKDNGWTINSSMSQPAIKNFDATKAAARLDITIAKDDKDQVTVNVSFVN